MAAFLRKDAIAEYQSTQTGKESDARAALTTVLAPEDVSALTVTDTVTQPTFTKYVLTDGDVYLAVVLHKDSSAVYLVSGSVGEWTDLAPIDSLATLGKVLPGLAPLPPPKTGPAPWTPGTAYAKGDLVTYNADTYKVLQAHTSQVGWEPPNVPALWSKVAA